MGKRILVCSGGGIGDTIQTTPMIQAVSSLGHEADVWMVADCPETVLLFEGWSPIRRLYTTSRDVPFSAYDEIIVTLLFPHARFFLRSRLPCHVSLSKELGDMNTAEFAMQHARRLGFRGPTPLTYAGRSSRSFSLPPRTIGLHPGSKTGERFLAKRWPYFPQLAGLLVGAGYAVVLVGTEADGSPSDVWPDGVRDFRGRLSLPDSAALLSQCEAVVANDSGLAHLASALGVPTLALFGPTSERNYAPARPNAHVLACSVACRPCSNPGDCADRHCLLRLHPGRVMECLPGVGGSSGEGRG